MSYKRFALLLAIFVSAAMFSSCGARTRRLTSIAVLPDGLTINGSGLVVNFKAIGTYENPTETRDITNIVVWASAAPQIISIDPNTGVALSGLGCGSNVTVTATFFANHPEQTGATVVGTAGVNVTQPPPSTCQ